MKKQSRMIPTAMFAAVCAMIFLTSCTTQDQKEAANDYQQSADQSTQEDTNDQKDKESVSYTHLYSPSSGAFSGDTPNTSRWS